MRNDLDPPAYEAAPLGFVENAKPARKLAAAHMSRRADKAGRIPLPLWEALSFQRQAGDVAAWLAWYNGAAIASGMVSALLDAPPSFRAKKPDVPARHQPFGDPAVTFAPIACDDEDGIAAAPRDFVDHPSVRCAIIVSDDSGDRTSERAEPPRRYPTRLDG